MVSFCELHEAQPLGDGEPPELVGRLQRPLRPPGQVLPERRGVGGREALPRDPHVATNSVMRLSPVASVAVSVVTVPI